MINKLKLIIPICILLTFLIIGCGSKVPQITSAPKNNGKVILRCVLPSYDGRKVDAFKNFASDVKRMFPDDDIYFSFVKGDENAYETKIKVLLSSDAAPDVFWSGNGTFSNELYIANAVKSVDKNLEDINYWNLVLPCAKVKGYKGNIYAVPFDDVSYGIMEINTDLFNENNIKIPKNINDLKDAVKQFKGKNIMPIALGGKDGINVYMMLEGFAYTIDPQVIDNILNGKDKFSGETFSEAAKSVKELIRMGAFGEKVENLTEDDAANLFYSGKAAMFCTGSWDLNTSYTKLNGKSDLLYYPSINKANHESLVNTLSGGVKKDCGLLISASSKYPKEAAQLAIEMSKYYNQYLYEKQGNAAVIYNSDKMGWKSAQSISSGMKKLASDITQNGNTKLGLFQDNISASWEKSIIEDSAAFITGFLSVDDYLKEMDNSIKLK